MLLGLTSGGAWGFNMRDNKNDCEMKLLDAF